MGPKVATILVAVGFASTSPASVITNSPSLPPAGTYRTAADVHACFNTGGGLACVSNGNHFGFLNIIRTFPSGNEDETFNSQFTGNLQIGGDRSPDQHDWSGPHSGVRTTERYQYRSFQY